MAFDYNLVGHDNLLVADPGNRRVIEYIVQNDLKQRKLPLNSETRINLYGPEKTYKTDSAPFAILDDGTLAVYNQTAKHIELLNDKGALAGTFAPAGKEPGQSNEPEGLAYAKKTGIIVADTGNSRVEIFTATGAYKTLLGEKGTFFGGDKEGRMIKTYGVSVRNPRISWEYVQRSSESSVSVSVPAPFVGL